MSCPECFSGHVHEGTPRGQISKVHGLDTYVSEPTDGRLIRGIIVIIPDAFGWAFVNNRLLADHYADKGDFKVFLPDFMNGTAAPVWLLDSLRNFLRPGYYLSKPYHLFWMLYGFIPFHMRNKPDKSHAGVKGWFEQLRKQEGASLPIGAAGFCWGGKHTVLLSHPGVEINGKPLIDAGFTGHPSMLKIPDDINKIDRPISFALAETDNQVSPEQCKEIRTIVEGFSNDKKGEARVYEGCGHGWCIRADATSKENEAKAVEAEDQCISWFNKHFKIAG